ncbi:MAG: hypothetical protein HQK49_09500 [Oligoflexia bacterium]|nr:hypothetical protein [Oligoflexia bacterium]
MKKKYFAINLILIFVISILSGCHSWEANRFMDELNKFLVVFDSSATMVKEHGSTDATKNYIVVRQDGTDNYVAYNLDLYKGTMSYYDFYQKAGATDLISDLVPNGGGTYLSPSTGLIFEESNSTAKDLEKYGAAIESLKLHHKGESLAAEFALSEERGIEIAKMIDHMNTISKRRALTESDLDVISTKVLGVKSADVQRAYMNKLEGNGSSDLDSLLEKAAKINRTSPEAINYIFNTIFK